MTIKEQVEAIKKCMKEMLEHKMMKPVQQKKGVYSYQTYIKSYEYARELMGYINGFAEALGVKITNHTLIAVQEEYEIKYLLSIEFMYGRTY